MAEQQVQDREIVAVRTEEIRGHFHIIGVKLADGRSQDVADVVRAIEVHECHYTMRPPEGSPAYTAHQETGLPLLVRVQRCRDCDEKTIVA